MDDFVDWCRTVFDKLIEVEATSAWNYEMWDLNSVSSDSLANALFGEKWIPEKLTDESYTCYKAMYWAITELAEFGLVKVKMKIKDKYGEYVYEEDINIEDPMMEYNIINGLGDSLGVLDDDPFKLETAQDDGFPEPIDTRKFSCSITEKGRRYAKNWEPTWRAICEIELEPDQEEFLRDINQHSPCRGIDSWFLQGVYYRDVYSSDADRIRPIVQALEQLGLISIQYIDYPLGGFQTTSQLEILSTYKGLVWETRRGFILESRFIDDLVREWETTSVDFKRELSLNTMNEKAEFVKDILSLVNTKASGRRWLIIGFDDKTHAYYKEPDQQVTQNRIEQILARYIEPSIDVRYELVEYRLGFVGKLEVFRDPKKLPYQVKETINRAKKSPFKPGDTFVRHGSQVVQPDEKELQALQEEGKRARG